MAFNWTLVGVSKIKIVLSAPERHLIRKYGYPFENIAKQLEAAYGTRANVEIEDEPYWWEQVVGNLSISVNEDVSNDRTCERICELAEEIEYELKRG